MTLVVAVSNLAVKVAGFIRRSTRDRRGAIAIILALLLPVIVGFLGLGVEVGLWFHAKGSLQSAADAAALSGAYERLAGNSSSVVVQAARQAAASGYNGSLDDSMVVHLPPQSGEFAGNPDAVEVIVSRELHLLFTSLFLDGNVVINAYAVAILTAGQDPFCVLALDNGASGGVSIGGTANVTLDCGMASNSSAGDAVQIYGSADVRAGNVHTAGAISISGSGQLTTETGEKQHAPRVLDPYASIPAPAVGTCDYTTEVKVQAHQTITLHPGVYCGGIRITSGNASFAPGKYILRGGNLIINGGTSIGTGIFFYFTERNGTYAKADLSGNGSITLTADADGSRVGADYTGMLFMQDRKATGTSNNFNGGGNSNGCTVLVASTVTFSGNSNMQVACDNKGVTTPGAPGNVALAG